MAAVAALLTSCSKDDTLGGPTRGKVTFEVSTPELATRAYGDGTTADNLYYAVYDVIENAMVKTNYATTDTTDDVKIGDDLKATVTIDLVEGRQYEVAFWAESANSPYIFNAEAKIDAEGNTVAEAKTVSYNPNASLTANNEDYDAFFAYVPKEQVKVGQVVNVDLKRPFAQLNIATNDTAKAEALQVVVKQTGVTVKAYTSLNLETGAVSGQQELTFALADKMSGKIVSDAYDWLTMNYILVNERENIDISFNFSDTKGKADYTRPYAAVPVQRNHRTNVIGSILTDPTDFNVEVKPSFETTNGGDNAYSPEGYYIGEDGAYNITNAKGLAYVLRDGGEVNAKGGVINIMNDIDMTGTAYNPIQYTNKSIVINGNYKTISNLNVTGVTKAALIGGTVGTIEIKDLTIADSKFVALNKDGEDSAAAFLGFVQTIGGNVSVTNCHVTGSEIGSAKYVGGLVAYKNGDKPFAIKNSSVIGNKFTSNYTEDGGASYKGHCGGIIGLYGQLGLIDNCKVTDNTFNVQGSRGGIIVGSFQSDANINYVTVSNNTGLTENVGSVNSGTWATITETADATEIANAIAAGNPIVLTGDVEYNAKIENNATIDLDGNKFKATGTINLNNNADLTMTGGDYEVNGTYGHIDVRPSSAEGSELLFEGVDFSYNKKEKTYGSSTNRLGSVVEICATVADAHTKIKFKDCTFDNAMVQFEGLSGKTGTFEAEFINCTFNALTSSAPVNVVNYVKGTIKMTGCTFNLECTSSTASAVSISPSSSTEVTLVADGNTLNAKAATPYTYDASHGETEADNVKVNGTPKNIKFISAYENATVTETNTIKTGIAAQ